MKYRYERINEDTGVVVDRITVDSAEELIKCIKNLEEFFKMNYQQVANPSFHELNHSPQPNVSGAKEREAESTVEHLDSSEDISKSKDEDCDFYITGTGKCNSKYRAGKPCNERLCPWKGGGSYAMAVHDQPNRINKFRKKSLCEHSPQNDSEVTEDSDLVVSREDKLLEMHPTKVTTSHDRSVDISKSKESQIADELNKDYAKTKQSETEEGK